MISRRALLIGLLASAAAPSLLRAGQFTYQGVPLEFDDPIELLKQRMNECYAITRQNMAQRLYGDLASPTFYLDYAPTIIPSDHWPCPYQTLDQSFWERAEQHYQRSLFWIEQGKPDYALGSLRKAAKWEDRARSLPE